MKNYYCEKCGSLDVFIDERGTQKALICGDCGVWIKWISKKELPLVERFILSKNSIDGNAEINKFKLELHCNIQRLKLNKEQVTAIVDSIFN